MTAQAIQTAQHRLAAILSRNGCFRTPNAARRRAESRTYKKGYEVRLVAQSRSELCEIRRSLRAIGIKPARPFAKRRQWIQPVYGRHALEMFREWSCEEQSGSQAKPKPVSSGTDCVA